MQSCSGDFRIPGGDEAFCWGQERAKAAGGGAFPAGSLRAGKPAALGWGWVILGRAQLCAPSEHGYLCPEVMSQCSGLVLSSVTKLEMQYGREEREN